MAYDIRRDRVGRGTVWYARSRKIRCRELIALLDKKSSSLQTFAGLRSCNYSMSLSIYRFRPVPGPLAG